TWLRLREMLAKNRVKMIRQTANKRMAQPAYKMGDLVMVDSCNMKSKRPSKKLDHKKIGPFKIIKQVGKRACRVQLPGQVKFHPTFHVSMLEPYRKSIQPGRQQEPPEPDVIDGEESRVIKEVVDNKAFGSGRNARVKYLTLWEDYPPSDAT